MYELIPIIAGICAGAAAARVEASRTRAFLLSVVALTAGVVAAVASGEASESWAFVIWDIAQALLAGALTMFALDLTQARGRTRP